MAERIYSHQQPDQLLATVFNIDSLDVPRYNAADEHEILQVSAMQLAQGRVIRPHQHLPTERNTTGTQESWILWSGRVQVQLYDLNQELIKEFELGVGDCMVLYRGGHSFTVLDPNTKLIEIKNGPYYGSEHDAKQIG
jgi:cupin fold WbuC family metalloprotein